MKKYFYIIFIATYSFSYACAQNEESLKGQFYLAPDFGLMLGTINRIEFSPAFGYHFTDRISIAAGFKYEFYSETRLYSSYSPAKTHIYGPRGFVRYTIFNNLGDFLPIGMNSAVFAHAEIESSSLERKYFDYPTYPDHGRFWYNTVLVGCGISQTASERVKINVLVLWNTDYGNISLYSNPIIRFGFQFFLRPKYQETF